MRTCPASHYRLGYGLDFSAMSRDANDKPYSERPRVSVVIPTLNEERHIGSLLSDLQRQSEPPLEVLVVDGGSEDRTVDIVRDGEWYEHGSEPSSQVRLYSSEQGVPLQRNYGGRLARGEIVVFFDADVRIRPGFLAAMSKNFVRRNLEIATPLYMPGNSTIAINLVHVVVNIMFAFLSRTNPSGSGQCIAIGRDVFSESGGFDERLTFDDAEFIHRVGARQKRRFGMVPIRVLVSDRRFREEGTITVVSKLIKMSNFFRKGMWVESNSVEYEFGKHTR